MDGGIGHKHRFRMPAEFRGFPQAFMDNFRLADYPGAERRSAL